eukprot:jgi/Bigna1/132487/aug1.17_g7195
MLAGENKGGGDGGGGKNGSGSNSQGRGGQNRNNQGKSKAWCRLGCSLVAVFIIPISLSVAMSYLLRLEAPVHDHGAVLITGSSSGIGKHVSFSLAKKGFTVFAGVRTETKKLPLVEEWRSLQSSDGSEGGEILPIVIDVTNTETITAALQEVDDPDELSK